MVLFVFALVHDFGKLINFGLILKEFKVHALPYLWELSGLTVHSSDHQNIGYTGPLSPAV